MLKLTRLKPALAAPLISNSYLTTTLGADFCKEKLGLSDAQMNDFEFDLLAYLGFSKDEIEAANIHVWGHDIRRRTAS